ncbi:MAG: hypothetical protein R3200_12010 [Xanthomonadales bacterium]|nr:hypothetical protein [Xanthomonadales bacterium]
MSILLTTKKHIRLLGAGMLVGVFWAGFAGAAEIAVSPGDGTLQAAIDDAGTVDGDTLLLGGGIYTHSAFSQISVTKSLTIRASARGVIPSIRKSLGIQAPTVILQGLELNNANVLDQNGSSTLIVSECSFVEGDLRTGCTGCLDDLFLFGTSFSTSGSRTVQLWATRRVYAAANAFTAAPGASIQISISETPKLVHFIGNEVTSSQPNLAGPLVDVINVESSRFIANRFDIRLDLAYGSDPDTGRVIQVPTPSIIRNNLFRLVDTSMLDDSTNIILGLNMVDVLSAADGTRIENNVFDFGNNPLSTGNNPDSGVIDTEAQITIQGNIFVNGDRPLFTESADTVDFNVFRNNLCFNNTNDSCPSGDGNLNADPLFVDTADYMLQNGSPAINAGPDLAFLVDLDGTRADMGLYGGPFPIDQYDAQRNDTSTAPFVFPVFDASRSVNVIGDLPISVIGIARIR